MLLVAFGPFVVIGTDVIRTVQASGNQNSTDASRLRKELEALKAEKRQEDAQLSELASNKQNDDQQLNQSLYEETQLRKQILAYQNAKKVEDSQLQDYEKSQLQAEANLSRSSAELTRLRQQVDSIKSAKQNEDAQLHALEANKSLEDAHLKQILDEQTELRERLNQSLEERTRLSKQGKAYEVALTSKDAQLNRSWDKLEKLKKEINTDKANKSVKDAQLENSLNELTMLRKQVEADMAAKQHEDAQLHALNASKNLENAQLNQSLAEAVRLRREVNTDLAAKQSEDMQLNALSASAKKSELQLNRSLDEQTGLRQQVAAKQHEEVQLNLELNSSLAREAKLQSEVADIKRSMDSQWGIYKAVTVIAGCSIALVAVLIATRCSQRNKDDAYVNFSLSSRAPLLKDMKSSSVPLLSGPDDEAPEACTDQAKSMTAPEPESALREVPFSVQRARSTDPTAAGIKEAFCPPSASITRSRSKETLHINSVTSNSQVPIQLLSPRAGNPPLSPRGNSKAPVSPRSSLPGRLVGQAVGADFRTSLNVPRASFQGFPHAPILGGGSQPSSDLQSKPIGSPPPMPSVASTVIRGSAKQPMHRTKSIP